MNFNEAKNKVRFKRVIGSLIAIPALVSTVVSFFKLLYLRLDDGTAIGSAFARPFKMLASWFYETTFPYLNWFWDFSPVPNPMVLSDIQNIYFVVIYLIFFVGIAFLASGKKLSLRLAKISQKIEDQLLEESLKGSAARTRSELESSVNVPSASIFTQLHQLYLAPIITAVAGAAIIKFVGA